MVTIRLLVTTVAWLSLSASPAADQNSDQSKLDLRSANYSTCGGLGGLLASLKKLVGLSKSDACAPDNSTKPKNAPTQYPSVTAVKDKSKQGHD